MILELIFIAGFILLFCLIAVYACLCVAGQEDRKAEEYMRPFRKKKKEGTGAADGNN